ncbi:MAG: pantoate--beta-alanine ligase [Opitutales bacterium]|nr:pantoate--beta-alanine ligase [Opitutales bacterium]
MKVLTTVEAFREWRRGAADPLGFVPTMGALHAGHFSLMEHARAECAAAVASVFVNPTQFDDPDDCRNYPKTWETDLALAREAGMDAVFAPSFEALYPDSYTYRVTETGRSPTLEGEHRPGHFDGVLTVVLKLFQIVAPGRAYFGEKDWQQLDLVRGMAEAFFLPLEVIACPTVREADGLAMSSRNRRLSVAARERAPELYRALVESATAAAARGRLAAAGFSVQYVEDAGTRRLAAVELEGVRLIDNIPLSETPCAAVGDAAPNLTGAAL